MKALLTLLALVLCAATAAQAQTAANAPPRMSAQDAAQTNIMFLEALAALQAGQPQAAIPRLRTILASDPSLVRVRLELGRAYFMNGQWADARREFVRVLSSDIPPVVRTNVLIFINRIDARRGFDWELDFAFTRLGREQNFDSDEIDLDFGGIILPSTLSRNDDQAWGVLYDVSARFAVPVAAISADRLATSLVFQPFLFGEYADPKSLRDLTFGASLGLQFAAPRTTTLLALEADRRDLFDRRFETTTGFEVVSEHRRGNGFSIFGAASYGVVDNHFRNGLDGSSTEGRVGLRQGIGSAASIGASVFGELRDANSDFDDYERVGLSVFGDIEPGFGLDIQASVYTAWRDFTSPNPLFADDPDEVEYGGTLRISKNDLFLASRFTPYVQFDGRRVDSGIDAFSFWESSVSVGAEKAF